MPSEESLALPDADAFARGPDERGTPARSGLDRRMPGRRPAGTSRHRESGPFRPVKAPAHHAT